MTLCHLIVSLNDTVDDTGITTLTWIDHKWTDLQSIITLDEARVGRPYSCCVTTVL